MEFYEHNPKYAYFDIRVLNRYTRLLWQRAGDHYFLQVLGSPEETLQYAPAEHGDRRHSCHGYCLPFLHPVRVLRPLHLQCHGLCVPGLRHLPLGSHRHVHTGVPQRVPIRRCVHPATQ